MKNSVFVDTVALLANPLEVRFIGSQEKIVKLREYARKIGVQDATDTVSVEEAFPGYADNPLGLASCGGRGIERV